MHLFHVRHLAVLLSGGAVALLAALANAGVVFAGGDTIHFP